MTSTRHRPDRTNRRPSTRLHLSTAAAAFVLLLAACGSGDDATNDDGAATASETTIEVVDGGDESQSETTEPAAAEPADEASAPTGDDAPCGGVLSQDEFESLVGRSVEFSGGPTNCLVIYADDSVGSMSVFSGNRGADVADELITKFTEQIQNAPDSGMVLDDGRGYVLFGGTVGVLGESGNFYQVVISDNAGVESVDVVVQNIADLLLTR